MKRLFAIAAASVAITAPANAAEPQASSADGRWQVTAFGQSIAVFEGGVRIKTLAAASRDGRARSAVAQVHYVDARRSFVIAFETLAELWELSIDPQAAPIFDGLVHDYRFSEALAEPGFLGVRRTRLDEPLRNLALDGSGGFVLGRASDGADGRARLHLVQLDVRHAIRNFVVAGDPDLSAANIFDRDGRSLIRVPDCRGGAATVIDLRGARVVAHDD